MQERDLAENTVNVAGDDELVVNIAELNVKINELYNSARLYSGEFNMIDRHYYRSALNDVSRVILKLKKKRVTAEWKYAGYEGRDFRIYAKYECTNCGQVEKSKDDHFCRNCGAHMKNSIISDKDETA